MTFTHLRIHSEYSVVDGLITIEGLIEKLRDQQAVACALTDQSNLFAAVKFYTACEKAGIKPILGADIWCVNSANKSLPFRVTLLCQNMQGYRNLTQIISRSYLEGQQTEFPSIEKNWFKNYTEGLIAISGGKEGDIGQALLSSHMEAAKNILDEWKYYFPNRFYLEIQRTGKADEVHYNELVIEFSYKNALPLVATNDVRFLNPDDFDAHEARVCIQAGVVLNAHKRPKNYTPEQYLKSPEMMTNLFSDIPEALENSVEISKRCNLKLSLGEAFLPKFPVPAGLTAEAFLTQKSNEGLKERLKNIIFTERFSEKNYFERLKDELSVINQMGFAGYFLIVADFIGWAKAEKIPVGPGRGSGAGSLTAYALGITDIDPLPYDLLFERFLNPERVTMPDFDVDFCMDNRDRVIDYVARKYGRESVSQIITFGTMAAKAVVRDVGRVLGHPYGYVDKIAKLIPFELGMTLEKALNQEADLRERYEKEEEVKLLFDLAMKLEGLTRNAGKHAGGVVIAPTKLTDFTPLYCEAGEYQLVSQFDKDDVEKVGLVKFDFLGLRTLTIIGWTVDKINQKRQLTHQPILDIHLIPLDDNKTFDFIKNCYTTAVFQLESRGMKELVKRLQPVCFEDIVALVALFRPGPLQSGMVDDFINRKHGRAKIHYPHPLLEPILKSTYGIILYQEQVAKIAQVLAGYTLGQADLLRRAMGKKKPEEMAKQRSIFINGAKKNQVDENLASEIFDLMEKFAGYGFNKSHSVAYALITYQTAYLKAHYPEEFMAAVLSSDMDKTDKVVNFLQEARRMRLKIIPPDINQCEYQFVTTGDNKILYGLGAIKGAGLAALNIILENRKKEGVFKDFIEFFKRIDSRKVNKRVLEALIKAGTFDCFQLSRSMMLHNLDDILQGGIKHSLQQKDLFGDCTDIVIQLKPSHEWTFLEKLQAEKEALGFYQTGHPLQLYQSEFEKVVSDKLLIGLITQIKTMFTKRGDRMAFIKLELLDQSVIEVTVFSELYEKNKLFLIKDNLIILEGELTQDEFTGGDKLLSRNLYSLDGYREKFAKALLLSWHSNEQSADSERIKKLSEILHPFKNGKCPIYVDIALTDSHSRFELGEEWRVVLNENLLQSLRLHFGESQVRVIY